MTYLRFIEELDRDTDRGSELAHLGECARSIQEETRPKKSESSDRKLPSRLGIRRVRRWWMVGRAGDAERGEFCG